MKWIVALTIVWAGITAPLMAMADGESMTGGTGSAPAMNGERGMQGLPSLRDMGVASEGEVRRVDGAVGKLTLRHGPLENLEMPAMTMVFRVKDPTWLAQLKVGDKVRFVAERVDGNLTVTALEVEER